MRIRALSNPFVGVERCGQTDEGPASARKSGAVRGSWPQSSRGANKQFTLLGHSSSFSLHCSSEWYIRFSLLLTFAGLISAGASGALVPWCSRVQETTTRGRRYCLVVSQDLSSASPTSSRNGSGLRCTSAESTYGFGNR